MKNYFIICLIYLFIANIFSEANDSVNIRVFNRAVDFVNYKSVELSLKNTEIIDNYTRTFFYDDSVSGKKIVNFLKDNKNFSETYKLSLEIDSIKEKYKNSFDILYIYNYLTKSIFSDSISYPLIYKFANKRKDKTEFVLYQNELSNQLKRILLEKNDNVNVSNDIDSSNNTNTIFDNAIFVINKYAIIIYIIGLIFLYIIFNLKLNKFKNSEFQELFYNKISSINFGNHRYNKFREEIVALIKEELKEKNINKVLNNDYTAQFEEKTILKPIVQTLNPENVTQTSAKIRARINPNNQPVYYYFKIYDINKNFVQTTPKQLEAFNDFKEVYEIINNLIPDSEYSYSVFEIYNKNDISENYCTFRTLSSNNDQNINEQIFYFSVPFKDGSFSDDKKTDSATNQSIYEFKRKINSNSASFKVVNNSDSVKFALSFPDSTLYPVCENLNEFNKNVQNIVTNEPGLSELIDNKWKLIKKAKIRYE